MPEWYDVLPPRDVSLSSRWTTAEFRDELRAWCERHVGPVTAMEQHKLRGWATVWRVTTGSGSWFAKQNCPSQLFEQPLMALLARLAPDRVVPVQAEGDGFLLTPDQGPVFHDTAGDDLASWERLARDAALLQRELVPHLDELAAAGVTTLSPREGPEYVAARVEQYAQLPEGDPRRLAPDVAERLRDHLPVVRRWAERVAGLGLPLTLNHNDLHGNNVFDVDGRLLFFDFGDALVTEPLGILLIPLNILAERLRADGDDDRLWRVADAALEVWTDLRPAAELRAALPAALQLGRLGRVESWVRCQPSLSEDELDEWGPVAAAWLGTLVEQPPVGSVQQ
ncbi:aminoglycoside phosphotransferase family protein [Nocardioides cynanchi]|uniref:aminoglycoside phosphotransferase family protein n=1 Tax=Nocardioides cynanchi TaxID=2558918 RepID=UPI001786623F|nr:aminoglycoside phosphotransferase family protein [Nocardioides cynanchi]